jgi:hypothetical protein
VISTHVDLFKFDIHNGGGGSKQKQGLDSEGMDAVIAFEMFSNPRVIG